ncbi:hypothetical protein MHU86_9863 [Fragilaria crotonensis]|nr:hypothetical protein MHU86_9863 [Fragilaria crotonensis]
MVASQLYRVEIDLKPIDENCGMPVEGVVAPPPIVQSFIPWSYNRHQIPDFFARKGVSLNAWERAVDSAEILFKDRNAALEKEKRECNGGLAKVALSIYFLLMFLSFMSIVALSPVTDDYLNNVIFTWQLAMVLLVFGNLFLKRRIKVQYPIILDRISSHFEEQWSLQVRNLNDEYEQYGITVETSRRKIKGQGLDLPWSVGFVFSFKMQPSNEEEAARLLAHSQTSDVSEAAFRRRTMRVVPEQPLMHLKPEAFGVTAVPAGDYAMALAVVVDNGDDDGNTGEVSEKKTLLDVV